MSDLNWENKIECVPELNVNELPMPELAQQLLAFAEKAWDERGDAKVITWQVGIDPETLQIVPEDSTLTDDYVIIIDFRFDVEQAYAIAGDPIRAKIVYEIAVVNQMTEQLYTDMADWEPEPTNDPATNDPATPTTGEKVMLTDDTEQMSLREAMRRIKPIAEAYWSAYTAPQQVINWMVYIDMSLPEDDDDGCQVHIGGAPFGDSKPFMFYFGFSNCLTQVKQVEKVKQHYYEDLKRELLAFIREYFDRPVYW